MGFISQDPVVHSCITFLAQDAEYVAKAFLSLDLAKQGPNIKLAPEQSKLTHLVSHVPVICVEGHIDRGLIKDRCRHVK